MQWIRACWWAAEKPAENPSRPNGAWPGLRNTTSSAIKLSKQTRSPALTASIQVECTSRIVRSSGPIYNLCRGRIVRVNCEYTVIPSAELCRLDVHITAVWNVLGGSEPPDTVASDEDE